MRICRYHHPFLGTRLGQLDDDSVRDLTATGQPAFATLTALLQASVVTPIGELLQAVSTVDLPATAYAEIDRTPDAPSSHLLPPVDQQEVWAAGVTYAWSREARVREARSKEVYVRVYEAERPELFFKSIPEKVIGTRDWIGIRGDSDWNVPEPELALVLNPHMQIVGFTIGNDVSSRDIEGQNPLYLPQAKIFRHSCALGPVIALADGEVNGQSLAVGSTILRDGAPVFHGETSTARMNRRLADLASYLGRYSDFPYGAILLTGTGIVPGDDFTLQDGDVVSIEIESIGVLQNPVKRMAQ